MALYSYKKKIDTPKRRAAQYASYAALCIGSILLFWSFYPVFAFEIYSNVFLRQDFLSPIPRSEMVSSLKEADSVLGSYDAYSNNLRDFTQVNLWFPTKPQKILASDINVKQYALSIPKLNIKNAEVIIGGEDLKKSLVHYLPETMPGENGNVVIFGHSTLPQLYNPKNYTTIFTYLPSLKKGDKIDATVGNQTYEYEVFESFVVNPDQVSVLEQKKDASYLTLITCVPPGTYWKRLVLQAKLIGTSEQL